MDYCANLCSTNPSFLFYHEPYYILYTDGFTGGLYMSQLDTVLTYIYVL